jgi:polar amino acid transport system ATP-binding protein
MPEPLIHIDAVTLSYGLRCILNGVSAEVVAGQTVALLGPSGGGKSSLLRCINGLNRFDAGKIRVGPHTLEGNGRAGSRETRAAVHRLAGMIFQDFQLFPHLTALGNVIEAPVHVLGKSRDEASEHGLELLKRVGLAERSDYYPRQLSGGQKQRVAIARALAMSPQVLLCDEITSALDPELKVEVLETLEDLQSDGLTLMMVTHEIGFARRAADQVLILAEGKIVERGAPADVLDNPSTDRTKQFLSQVLG